MSLSNAALLLLGHGSTLNADSSAPTYQHAEEIRRRGIFAEVHVAFWKEEPNFRQALRQTTCTEVYVVPNFISSGYFTEQVIPRELGLSGTVTNLEGKRIHYCTPVGLGPEMTEVLMRRAREVVAASRESLKESEACVFICGHGTSFNDNSTKIIYDQAEIIREKGIYADCQAVLMEQRPFVKDWRTLTDCRDVIVVPFFISDGLHSYEDIPVLLGLTHNIHEKGFTNPHREGDRRLWYATAIGTEPFIADVIVDLARRAEMDGQAEPNASAPLSSFVKRPSPPWTIGQVLIESTSSGFELRHVDDRAETSQLTLLGSLTEIREMILRDAEGNFRPLRAAPNLSPGWIMHAANDAGLIAILDYLYPAEIANWQLWQEGKLRITPWRETAERQTGRFRIVRGIDDAAAQELVAQVCQPGCLKRRLWSPAAQGVAPGPNEIPLLCPEACNYFVGKAREKLKGPGED